MNSLFRVLVLQLVTILLLCAGCDKTTPPSTSAKSIRRITILQQGKHPILEEVIVGCENRLKELYGDQVIVERRNGGGDDAVLRQEATQATSGQYALVIPVGSPPALALLGVSDGKTPILFTFVTYPAAIGYSGPGSLKNVTGLINGTGYDGTLDALQGILPGARRIGYLVSSEPNARHILSVFQDKARKRNLELVTANIESGGDVPQASRSIANGIDCFLVGGDHTLVKSIDPLLDVADLFHKPVFAVDEGSVAKGAIAASTISYKKMGIRTAEYASFILAGADPDRLPPETYENFELVINTKACARFGLTVPESLLKTARSLK